MKKQNKKPTEKKKEISELAFKFKSQKIAKNIDFEKHKVNFKDLEYKFTTVTKVDGTKFITRSMLKNDLVLDIDESIFFSQDTVDNTNACVTKFRKNFKNLDIHSIK